MLLVAYFTCHEWGITNRENTFKLESVTAGRPYLNVVLGLESALCFRAV